MKNKILKGPIMTLLVGLVLYGILNSEKITQQKQETNLIGTYINGKLASTIPSKTDGYIVEKIVCDNNTVGKWDDDNWGLSLTNLTKKSKCNVYFRTNPVNNIIKELDTTGSCPTVNTDGSVNVASAESENSLLCSAPDNYGTSYYFRGNVSNNYVKFANFYWRIVRINGDGSIRVIFDGTTAHANGESSEDRIIGYSAFNEKSDDNAYIGYMYGTPGSSTYEETHANINDSTIKKYIDNWYKNNLEGTAYEQYLADNIFCNDRTILNENIDGYSNKGYSKEKTAYIWYTTPWSSNRNVSINCKNQNDAFTLKNKNGNKSLKYAIGLLSADELVLAGGFSGDSQKYYLYSKTYYWLSSPSRFTSIYANMHDSRLVGYPSTGNNSTSGNHVSYSGGVKPVINLKPQSILYGNGTINNPYRATDEL